MNTFKLLYNIGTDQLDGTLETIDEELIYNAKLHRMIPTILSQSKHNKIDGISFKDMIYQRKEQSEALKQVIRILEDLQIKYVFLKGIGMEAYYPNHLKRQFNDYDILLDNYDEFCTLFKKLNLIGFDYEYVPVFTRQNERVLGLVKVFKELNHGNSLRIEFNVGGFPTSEVTWLVDPELLNEYKEVKWKGVDIRIPNPNMSMVILIAEVGSNNYKRIRDAVDFQYLLPKVDMEKVFKKIKRWRLVKEYKHLQRMIKDLQTGKFKNTKFGARNTIKYRFKKDKQIIYLLFQQGFFRGIIAHYMNLIGNYLIHEKSLKSVVPLLRSINSPYNRFNSGIPTSFIPLDLEDMTSNKLQFIKIKKYSLVISRLGVFLMSDYCLEKDEELIEIEKQMIKLSRKKTKIV